MFINKWLVTDSVDDQKIQNEQTGYCLYVAQEPADPGSLYKFMQRMPVERAFAILLQGDDFNSKKTGDSYVEKIISLFFQPCYYLVNYQPLIFLKNRTPACSVFLERLLQRSRNQGLLDILIVEIKNSDSADSMTAQHAYHVNRNDINYSLIVKNWVTQYLDNKNPTEIHFLISATENELVEILNSIGKQEIAFRETEWYKIAINFYHRQKLIDDYKHELHLKTIREENNRLYLSIQREQTAANLRWYHEEYEILPLWYKRLGHIIKVIMGKRSLRSLFRNNGKKEKA